MATYKILTTPGREEVNLHDWLGDQAPERIDSQDKCRIVISGLRAIERKTAKIEKRNPRDFVAVRVKDLGGNSSSSSSTGTSIRLTEEVRRELAKICGAMMAQTGDPVSMGDAVMHLIDFYRDNIDAVTASQEKPKPEPIKAAVKAS